MELNAHVTSYGKCEGERQKRKFASATKGNDSERTIGSMRLTSFKKCCSYWMRCAQSWLPGHPLAVSRTWHVKNPWQEVRSRAANILIHAIL